MSHRKEPAPVRYEIEVGVHLRGRLRDAFPGLVVTEVAGGSLLTGMLADQAALYGVIGRLRDLGIPLLGVRRLP